MKSGKRKIFRREMWAVICETEPPVVRLFADSDLADAHAATHIGRITPVLVTEITTKQSRAGGKGRKS